MLALLLAGWVVWPALADSPTLVVPERDLATPAVDGARSVDEQIAASLAYTTTAIEPQVTATPLRDILVKLEGTIVARPPMKEGNWQIDDHAVSVLQETEILPIGYDPKVGDHVVVNALRTPLSLIALRITVQKPGEPDLVPIEFRGAINACSEMPPYWGKWIVAGTPVSVTLTTLVIGLPPRPGLYAQVRGRVSGEGLVLANYVQVVDPSGEAKQFQFKGLVQVMSSNLAVPWVIGGVPGYVTLRTDIENPDKIGRGSLVKVKGERSGTRIQFTRIALVEEAAQVYLEGLIQQAQPESYGEWVIGDKSVIVDEATFVDESDGRAELGMWARVTAMEIDGVYRALRIRVERP
jgi:hypothetical protein